MADTEPGKLRYENVAFLSSGDPEEDAREAAHIRRRMAFEAEGLCPNGDAPLTWPDRDDVAVCPACGFVGVGMDRARYEVKPHHAS